MSESLAKLHSHLADLTPRERELLQTILREKKEKGSSDSLYQLATQVYDELPVTMDKFLHDPHYLNLEDTLYPKISDLLMELDDPNLREFYLVLGKGSGKSTVCTAMMARTVYRVLCLKDPYKYFGSTPDSGIAILNMSTNGVQAENVIWRNFCNLIQKSPWFKAPQSQGDSKARFVTAYRKVQFDKGVYVMAGNSSERFVLGHNTIFGMIDEANYIVSDKGGNGNVHELVRGLKGSLQTRFPQDYKLGLISSAKTHEDYLFEQVNAVKERGIEKRWEDLGKDVKTVGYH